MEQHRNSGRHERNPVDKELWGVRIYILISCKTIASEVEREAHKHDVQLDIDICASGNWISGLRHSVRFKTDVIRISLTTGVGTSGWNSANQRTLGI